MNLWIYDNGLGRVNSDPVLRLFDDAKVKAEVANISNVTVRYGIPLEYGLIQDLDQGLAALNSQLKAAGIDKVQQEMQSQIDAFLAK